MKIAAPLDDLSEKDWQRQVVALAKTFGWRCYHTLRSKGSQPGYPDLTLVHDKQRRVLWLELKAERGATTDKQREWLTALHQAGSEVYVARPRHLDAIATVLQRQSPSYRFGRDILLLELDKHLQEAA